MNDDFGVWELRGAVIARPQFLYTPLVLRLNPEKPFRGGEPLDFDRPTRPRSTAFATW